METVLRVAILYLFLLVAFRMMGKRELGQMSAFELVTLMMVPEIVSPALNRQEYSIVNGLVGVSTLFLLVAVSSMLSHRFRKLGRVLEGKHTVLVANGQMRPNEMNRERIAPDELFTEMRKSGIERLEDVRFAILETDGHISFVTTEPHPERRHAQDAAL